MNAFERQHIRDIALRNRNISLTIDSAMKDIAHRFQTVKGKRFASIMDGRLKDLHDQLLSDSKAGIRNQWMLANKMNNKGLDGYLASVKISDRLNQSFRSPNISALNAFMDRSDKGLNLSGRVWNITDGVKTEMNGLISSGVLQGKSAVKTAKELSRYVKGSPIRYKGKLIKGQNIDYRAIRLAATEANMAFRTADYLQNSKLPFVTGVTVELSPAHPFPDICDEMAGDYPKGFHFTGWHPNCICFVTHDTMPPKEFVDYIKTGEINQGRFTTRIPSRATRYLKKNGERIQGYKNTPYWMKDNFTEDLALKEAVRVKGVKKQIAMVK